MSEVVNKRHMQSLYLLSDSTHVVSFPESPQHGTDENYILDRLVTGDGGDRAICRHRPASVVTTCFAGSSPCNKGRMQIISIKVKIESSVTLSPCRGLENQVD